MNVPFADIEAALRNIATWERHRIELTHWHAVRGYVPTLPENALSGWQERLIRIEAGHRLVSILTPHETTVRDMHEQLRVPVVPRPKATSWEI